MSIKQKPNDHYHFVEMYKDNTIVKYVNNMKIETNLILFTEGQVEKIVSKVRKITPIGYP